MSSANLAFGIDIGGSGIKGAIVDLDTGSFATDRVRIPTPHPSTPDAVAQTCKALIEQFDLPQEMPIGITFPAPVVRNTVIFIANLDPSWAGVDVADFMWSKLGRKVYAVNDADAAGYAEVVYGAAKDVPGTIIVTTLGTGIGSAIIFDGNLLPNTELGHLEIDGKDAESRASSAQKERRNWSYKQWAKRLQRYYSHVEMLFSPDLFVVGGGISRKHKKFLPLLELKTPIVPAKLRNTAGIVGAAALAAAELTEESHDS
ncbi:MAG: ROK family protein [Actinomycetaceae bacterium]|nr:ROK family protein [Actinomycetaceae bacterium]